DGTMPLDLPLERAPGSLSSPKRLARGDPDHSPNRNQPAEALRGDQNSMIGSLAAAGARSRKHDEGATGSRTSEPGDFVWPGRGRGAARDGERSSSAIEAGEQGSNDAPASPAGSPSRVERREADKGLISGAGNPDPLPGRELAQAEKSGSFRGT